MKQIAKKIVVLFIHYFHTYYWKGHHAVRAHLLGLSQLLIGPPPAGTGIHVYYGRSDLPLADSTYGGGIIKCNDLVKRFPAIDKRFNIMYIVNSALPYCPPVTLSYAKRIGAKLVLNQNGVAYRGWHGDGWERQNDTNRLYYEQASYIFFQSRFSQLSAETFVGPAPKHSEVLYNPVDTKVFVPRTEYLPLDPICLLLAGSHWHFYRIQAAIDTLYHLRDAKVYAHLFIAGRCRWKTPEAAALKDLQDYVQKMGLTERVTWLGPYRQQNAAAMFHKAHILLHTKYNDPCPRLVVEAMASGLPIVYSKTGGLPELVGEEAGIGVPSPLDWEQDHPPAPEALSEAVQVVAYDYEAFRRQARQRAVERFDLQPWLDRHEVIFKSLVG